MARHRKPTPQQNAGRLVRKATLVLQERGWIQRDFGTGPNSPCCAVGAIHRAASGDPSRSTDASQDAVEEFGNWLHDNVTPDSIIGWNDRDGNSKDNVIAVMRRFADEVDPQ